MADNRAGGDDRLGDGARAVSDGESGGLSDGPGLGAVGDLSRTRAVGGVDVNDLGGDSDVAVGSGASGGGKDSGDSELHCGGIKLKLEELRIRYVVIKRMKLTEESRLCRYAKECVVKKEEKRRRGRTWRTRSFITDVRGGCGRWS